MGNSTTTRQRIAMAVANGCRNTRQIAARLGMAHGAVNNYFYDVGNVRDRFKNGDVLQWVPGKTNTIRLGPRAAVVRHKGKIVEVMKVEQNGH